MAEIKLTQARRAMLYRICESGPMLVKGGKVRNYLQDNGLICGAGMMRTSISAGGYTTYTQTYDITIEGLRALGRLPPVEESPGPVEGEPQMYWAVPPGGQLWNEPKVHYEMGDFIIAPLHSVFQIDNVAGYNLYKDQKVVTTDGEEWSPCLFFTEVGLAFAEIGRRT